MAFFRLRRPRGSCGQSLLAIASCKLHGIEPERYLAEVIRILPYWPRERVLELAPSYWTSTRARLDPTELDAELGAITVPPLATDAPEQASAS